MRSYPARALAMDGWRSEDSRAFDHSLSESEAARVERIRAALEGDRLRLLALPVADLRTGDAAGEELLVRLVRSNGRLDRPAGFMPPPERRGAAGGGAPRGPDGPAPPPPARPPGPPDGGPPPPPPP